MKTKINLKALFAPVFIAALCLLVSNTLFANNGQVTVTGIVSNAANNKPIQGASITIKGTSTTVKTNANGQYSIVVSSVKTVLVFSSGGYLNEEHEVGNRTVINVALKINVWQFVYGDSVNSKVGSRIAAVKDQKQYEETEMVETILAKRIVTENEIRAQEAPIANDAYYISSNKMDIDYYDKTVVMGYAAPQSVTNTEEYGSFVENKFLTAQDNPLSTFSIDVDAASYSNIRRFINHGQIPPKDAVRTEEMINYFDYNYPQPTGKHPINVITEISACPWNEQNRLLHIGIKAKDVAAEELPASNLVFLIDVSGSMDEPNKLPMVKSSMKMLVNQLRDKDKVAIVVYAGAAGEVLPSTSGKEKAKINQAIDNLNAGGSTAGGAGIKLAYKIAKDNLMKDGNNRVILATDGDFNVGVSSNEGLEQMIEKERKSGVFLTVLGYGMGNYKDSKMQVLAQKGNGNHAYIDNLNEAQKVLVNEFGGTLFTIAKDVKLQLEFNPAKVQAYRLIGYESRLLNKEDFNDDTKDAGEMGAGHTVTALYEIIPTGVKSNLIGTVDELKYQKNIPDKSDKQLTSSGETLTVKIRYKKTDSETSERMDIPVVDTYLTSVLTSNNFRFSAAVAEVGMMLFDSPYKGKSSYTNAISLAKSAYGEDKDGYRHEFVKLIENLNLMSGNNNNSTPTIIEE